MMKFSSGWIEAICGSMFSGKSEELIRRVRRAEIARQKVQVFKPTLDTRSGNICSHSGLATGCVLVDENRPSLILEKINPGTHVVAIDEIQFFTEGVVPVCQELADRGLRVIVAGLDQDFRGRPFGPMPTLLAVAEVVDKLQAICSVCGSTASRSQRLIDGVPAGFDSPTIAIGASEKYEARCRRCHQVPGGRNSPSDEEKQ